VHGLAQDDAALAEMAACMHEAGLGGPWRSELLAVANDAGQVLGRMERGAVRPLGLATEAVHLIGLAPDGRMWAQRRALSKPNDPGLHDTLMGGMISAADGLHGALARETWEEAGLRLPQLQDLRHGGQVYICKPSRDGRGMGYMRETLHWFVCTVPEGVVPANQDGEVDGFELLTPSEVLLLLEADRFTTEAALVLAAAFAEKT
jgi:8-oxo-dGTP pyrophosphatase MutT (NUDIX family)